MSRPILSVALRTFNSGLKLQEVLASVAPIANEIIVVDSFSTDNTQEIAKTFGALVFEEAWKGYGGQGNSAIAKCSGEWILFLDHDEVLSKELAQSIQQAIQEDEHPLFDVARKTHYLGRLLHYTWQPDHETRLFKRSLDPTYGGNEPHVSLQLNRDIRPRLLDGYLLHYSYRDLNDHIDRLVSYAKIGARTYYHSGKRSSFAKIFSRPLFGLFKIYILRRGFLDGLPGLIAAGAHAVHVFLKYAFLWELQRAKRSDSE